MIIWITYWLKSVGSTHMMWVTSRNLLRMPISTTKCSITPYACKFVLNESMPLTINLKTSQWICWPLTVLCHTYIGSRRHHSTTRMTLQMHRVLVALESAILATTLSTCKICAVIIMTTIIFWRWTWPLVSRLLSIVNNLIIMEFKY